MAAYAAASNGNSVLLFEKNEKLGKKIYITGKGRCNLTNDCAPDEFLAKVVRGERFMTGALWSFSPQDLMGFMEKYGLPLQKERGNRVFPASGHASDVTKTLERACREAGAQICLNEGVEKIILESDRVCAVKTAKGMYECSAVIVATGGLSYPSTGSTGDGYRFARAAGHSIIPPVPSLTGLNLRGDYTEIQGQSLKNVVLSARLDGKVIYSESGELLFTHYGVSGPLVLALSALINRKPAERITLYLDLKPGLDDGKLDARLLRDLSERKNEQMKNVMRGLLPGKMGLFVLRQAEILPEKQANSLTKQERGRLVGALKAFRLAPVLSLRGFEEAVVTSGGVDLKEINPKTMESRLIKDLYFAGETLDIDAFTGGFNLQLAFSSGFAAGNAIK